MDIPMEMHKINAIPLGKKAGFMAFNKMAVANPVYADKIALRNRFIGVFKNEKKWKDIAQTRNQEYFLLLLLQKWHAIEN